LQSVYIWWTDHRGRVTRGALLDAPGGLDGSEAGANYASSDYNSRHPGPRAKFAHDEIRRQVKDDVGNIEQGQGERCVLCGQAQNSHEVVSDIPVHRLRDTNVRSDGGAHEIEDPESYKKTRE
jgi:hypothetical protein